VRVPLVTRGGGGSRLLVNYLSFVLSASILGAWRLRGRSFDAILVFQPSPITSCLPAILLGKIKRAPVTLWVLDLWPETLSAIGVVKSPAALALVGRMVSFIYRHCDLVLGQSRAFLTNIAHYKRESRGVRYFPGWSEATFTGSTAAVEPAPETADSRDTFNVLFAGNIGEAQDFPAILDAVELLRDHENIRWLIVGDGRAASWVATEIQRRGLERNVRMLGRHPLERMPSFFAAADALLVSLKRDPVFAMTIPGKVQSYLAASVPLIGMLDGEGSRVIEESGAGFVSAAGDSAGLAQSVLRLAALSHEERERMGERGAAYCRREFDRDTLLSQLESWMRDLYAGRASAPA
jgi:glycosyltransferase involved in cell wall biosynthesis